MFIGKWMFGPNVQREKVIMLENNVRKGGDFKFLINRKGQDVEVTGEIKVLDIPRRLELSWQESTYADEECLVIVQFDSLEGKTKLKLTL